MKTVTTYIFLLIILNCACNKKNSCFELTNSNKIPDDVKCIEWHYKSNLIDKLLKLKRMESLKIYFDSNYILPVNFCELKSIKKIEIYDIPSFQCSNILKQISCLKQLEYLYIDFGTLKTIPTEIGVFYNLKQLDLSFKDDIIQIPIDIANLKKLKIVNIYKHPNDSINKIFNKVLPKAKINYILE